MPELDSYPQTGKPGTSTNGENLSSIDQELDTSHPEAVVNINNEEIQSHIETDENIKTPEIGKHHESRRHNVRLHIPKKINNYFKHENHLPTPTERDSESLTDSESPQKLRYAHTDGEVQNKFTHLPDHDETDQRYHFGFNFNRTNTIMDDAHINLNNLKYSVGERVRKVIYRLEDILGPAIKKVIPNFIIAHYVYILFWIIIGSVVIYPAKNMEYVDALMYSTGASTQGGLATTQMNEMKLYQQIAVYVICMLTTPIFIHGSLTFLRLYWYEKRFDNIKQRSIQQYKMRRTQTIANLRTETMHARTMTGTSTNRFQSYDSHNASEGLASRMKRFENNLLNKSSDHLPTETRSDSNVGIPKINTPRSGEFDDTVIHHDIDDSNTKNSHKTSTTSVTNASNLATPTRLRFENVRFQEPKKQDNLTRKQSEPDYVSHKKNEPDYFFHKRVEADYFSRKVPDSDYFAHNPDKIEHYCEPSDEDSNAGIVSSGESVTGHQNTNDEDETRSESDSKSDHASDGSNSDEESDFDENENENAIDEEPNDSEPTRGIPDLKVDTSSNINLSPKPSPTVNSPNIKFGELPKPIKKKREIDPRDLFMSISVLQNNPNKNEDIETGPALKIKGPRERDEAKSQKRKLPGHRLKHRKLLKERKLKKLKEKGREMVENQRKLLDRELDELEKDDFTFKLPQSFDIETSKTAKDKKTKRSLSVPTAFADNNIQSPTKSFMLSDKEEEDEEDTTEGNNINPISTNDREINEKLKKMERSHTIHISEFPKKMLSTFETEFNRHPRQDNDDDSNKDEDDSDNNEHHYGTNSRRKSSLKNRRPSFFTRTMTNLSRRRTFSDPEVSDEELVDHYLTRAPTNYLSWNPTVGRNSKFITLSGDQKFELGGVEYQAMKLLSKLLVMYYVGFHIAGIVFFVPFATTKNEYVTKLREDGISPTWWAFFNSMSSFNDLGYSLNVTSMILFAQNAYVLVISAFFIVIGNTGFPIFLRLIIWTLRLFTRPLTMTHDSLSFLLDHPRRCFTLLFPSGPTWWLTVVLLFLNAFDWILFIILDYGSSTLSYLPKGYQVLAGLFQSIATRTAGFNVVNLSTLHPAIQLSYMVMMYISVLPIAISVRRTNVYEEQSLGVYDRDEEAGEDTAAPKLKYIGTHLRKQLSFDLWFLFLAIFIICIVEGGRIRKGDVNFGIFQIMFEVTSAYGTVGLSLGYPTSNTSFCGEFTKLSKLVIIATLIRGRHRGLPNSIDRAIMLSDQNLNLRDDLEAYHAMRRNTTVDSEDVDSLFPSISRAATRASRHDVLNREPTISENLKQGVIPFKSIAKGAIKTLGKVASNILTVSGTPVDKYSRQMTKYSTYEMPYRTRSRSATYSEYNRTLDGVDESEEDFDDDEDYIDGRHNAYGESIPLYSVRGNRGSMHRKMSVAGGGNRYTPQDEEKSLHTRFVDHMNEGSGRSNGNVQMQEGSSNGGGGSRGGDSSSDGTPIIRNYDGFNRRMGAINRYRTNESEAIADDDEEDDDASGYQELNKYVSR